MSINVNKVLLAGNIASDITVNETKSGMPVANFRLAVNSKVSGEEKTMFIDVAVFGAIAEAVNKYCSKGSSVLVDGRLDEDTWMKDNEKRFKHFVTAQSVSFLNTKPADKGGI